jgi:hypothetical protein
MGALPIDMHGGHLRRALINGPPEALKLNV